MIGVVTATSIGEPAT